MDSWNKELDFWDKVLKKTIEIKTKSSLQPTSNLWEIDSCCYQDRRLIKKDKTWAFFKFSRNDIRKKAKPANI